jgi:hypothetical protein
MIDRVIRIVVGILLIAFALRLGFPETGWNWIGWIGVIPILTAIFGYCPAYTIIGLSTCPLTRKETGPQRWVRARTSISSFTLRRCSRRLPLVIACSTQWPT